MSHRDRGNIHKVRESSPRFEPLKRRGYFEVVAFEVVAFWVVASEVVAFKVVASEVLARLGVSYE